MQKKVRQVTSLLKEKNGDNMIYAVAMSGGVDSSVAAYLLKEQGHQVIGFTMYHFDDTAEPFKRHSISRAIDDARTVCQKLEIEHFTIDLKAEFNHLIIKDFLTQYQ
ncbi:MAG: 7-cyano-7-deazaguanine synthase, partial [Candidatus Cloacimonetes bacterium]|nr:7-cyano-7-deazaguanine synthase [Candidatus Cloacimonadota bacterium]